MYSVTRRAAMLNTLGLLGGAAIIAGCATTHVGTTTTITLDVSKIKAYADAGLSAAKTVESVLVMVPALAIYVVPVQTITAALQAALNVFTTQAGTKITLVYNDANVKAIVDSILNALEQLGGLIKNIVVALPASVAKISTTTVNQVELVYNALMTIVAVFRTILTIPTTPSGLSLGTLPTSQRFAEMRALSVLHA